MNLYFIFIAYFHVSRMSIFFVYFIYLFTLLILIYSEFVIFFPIILTLFVTTPVRIEAGSGGFSILTLLKPNHTNVLGLGLEFNLFISIRLLA